MFFIRSQALLSVLFLTATACFAAIDNPNNALNWHEHPTGTLSSAERALQEAADMERLLRIPAGYLQPVYAFDGNTQADLIARHLLREDSRYMWVSSTQDQRASVFATPWIMQSPHTGARQRGVLFFRVHQLGIPVPMFHSGLDGQMLPNMGIDLWQYFDQRAVMSKGDLVRLYPRLRDVM